MVHDLHIKGTRVFRENYNTDKKIVVNRGGTRSSKSWSISQIGVWWLFTGLIAPGYEIPAGVWSEVRKTLPALKATAYRDYLEIIHKHDLYKYIEENKSDRTLSFGPRMIEFFSVDDQQKVRSRKRDILHINEANEIDFKQTFNQLNLRTKHRVFLDFNPDDPDIWINTEIEQKRQYAKKDVKVIVSTYKDNPYLSKEEREEIEYLKEVDPELWEVFGRGEYGKLTGLIYPHFHLIDSFPEHLCKIVGYGIDFGFTDPMAVIKVGVNDLDLYLEEKYYERGKITHELIEAFPALSIPQDAIMYGDSASPGKVQEVYNAGFRRMKPAKKGPGSIKDGIDMIKKYRIHITANSTNLLSEQRKYKWAVDKYGEVIPGQPIDAFNHTWDAVRYFIYTHLFSPVSENRVGFSVKRNTQPIRRR